MFQVVYFRNSRIECFRARGNCHVDDRDEPCIHLSGGGCIIWDLQTVDGK